MSHFRQPAYSSVWASLLCLLAIPVLNIFYGILNKAGDRVFSLETSFDHLIPFAPIFVIPYLLWYPFITGVLVLLAFKNRRTYFQTLIALCSGLIISYICFASFQTGIQRPEVHSEKGILSQLISLVYKTDQPYNCFPSIHVLTSYLMLRGSRVFNRYAWALVTVISILIILSTVFVKQHVVLDILGGIVAGELCFFLSGVLIKQKTKKQQSAT
ncbi:phosphatase PAP2 family protein [Paenibacillus sp. ACRRY]|uniref:phosphatase PAP2 family protein n=1 Tax=Paenibacillus sp. ACRRY TaxID=2918208 RepID=UPI001EF5A2E6|nr:phosphatase PAP2 family protein [Paenibacillus sp. ACRRY]MCG7381741.1 phosphatase PAP2 family protein [Paenibacillus sp. ACRRY]